jgi:hypothetical protein
MHLGEVSGMAAAQAIKEDVDIQKIDVAQLQSRIVEAGIPLEWTETEKAKEASITHPQFGTLVSRTSLTESSHRNSRTNPETVGPPTVSYTRRETSKSGFETVAS